MRVSQQNDADVPIRGYLSKKHAHQRTGIFAKQWGRRYVTLNMHRGTLAIGKSEGDSRPTTILPLCDITLIKEVEGGMVDWTDGCFTISCPPQQLTLRANDREERERWMKTIRSCSAEWKSEAKLAQSARKSGVPTPIANFYTDFEPSEATQ